MITASIVLFNIKDKDLKCIIDCTLNSQIDKIYIIDNSPDDSSRIIIEQYNNKRLEYNFGHGNIGYGRAHNIAIKKSFESGSDYHVILNPDISFKNDIIKQLASFMEQHTNIGLVMPKIIYPNGNIQYLCKLLPTPIDIIGRRLLPKGWIKKRNYKYQMIDTGYNNTRNIPCTSGCFMFIRNTILKQVGLFDNRFFMYFEDYDLSRRIHKISETVFYPMVSVIHSHASEHRTNHKMLFISIRSAIKYFNKWGWFIDIERWKVNKKASSPQNIIKD